MPPRRAPLPVQEEALFDLPGQQPLPGHLAVHGLSEHSMPLTPDYDGSTATDAARGIMPTRPERRPLARNVAQAELYAGRRG